MYKLTKGILLFSGEMPGTINIPTTKGTLAVMDYVNSAQVLITDSPFVTYRGGGDFSFQICSHSGEPINIQSISVPGGDSLLTTVPFSIDGNPTSINLNGYNSGDIVITHDGLNSPFIISVTVFS